MSLQRAFELLNANRNITNGDHISGRLVSKIQNSFIFYLSDGGKFSNGNKVFDKNSRINLSNNNNNANTSM